MLRAFSLIILLFSQVLFSTETSSKELEADVLIVGGSQSGVAAAIQSARLGSRTILVSQENWLGGSMIEGGVSAIDGNELLAFQTGLWGEFINKLAEREKNLLKYGWVSFFTFNPSIGNKIMHDWVASERNIVWLKNLSPVSVSSEESGKYKRLTGVTFSDGRHIKAKIIVDATEMGDLLKLGKVRHRFSWEYSGEFKEPSAPNKKIALMERYPVQEMTWAFFMKDYGKGKRAPKIEAPVGYTYEKAAKRYWCAFENKKLIRKSRRSSFDINGEPWGYLYHSEKKNTQFFSPETFLTYGQVSPDLFMINWPKCGNDYSLGILRSFSDDPSKRERFYKEARTQSLWFAKYIQDTLGERFGLAWEIFPPKEDNGQIGGFAYIPYNREVRRLEGIKTLTEVDILPDLDAGEQARYLPDSIAIGNYANDHHYYEMAHKKSAKYFKLAPKSIQWGGRYTGTPFSIPYLSLVPVEVEGLIVAEKSWSVSHIANGASRLQPVCMLVGQAAGAAAALAAQRGLQPYELPVSDLQTVLLNDPIAPPTLIPLFDVKPDQPYRAAIQRLIISGIIPFPKDGYFKPSEIISEQDFQAWSEKAGLNVYKLQSLFPDMSFPPNLTRAEAAQLIELEANTFGTEPPSKQSGQPIADFPVQKYCANLKQGGNPKSFKVEWIKDADEKPITRQTPFASNVANTAGAVTLSPEVYDYFLANASKNEQICFQGAYNHSGAWMLITEILTK